MNQTDWIVAISAMVSAVATVVLTIFTAVYVRLTSRLVRVQEQPLVGIRLQAQELEARSLATRLINERPQIKGLSRCFPLDLTKQPSEFNFESLDLATFVYELGSVAAQLPQPLASLCLKACMDLNAAALNLATLQAVIKTEEKAAIAGNRTWSWDEAQKTYLTTIRPRLKWAKPEWEDIVTDKTVSDAERSLLALHHGLVEYLQKPGDVGRKRGTGGKANE